MYRQVTILTVVLVVASLGVLAFGPPANQSATNPKVRIGVYDNRAVAIAYASSKHNPVGEKMAAYEAAKQAGDEKKVKELESWGIEQQRLLHFQGFGHVPVGDLLEHVDDGVADVAQQYELATIVMEYDYVGADVEVVDVTMDLVELFNPSDLTRKRARDVRGVEPLTLITLADMPADH